MQLLKVAQSLRDERAQALVLYIDERAQDLVLYMVRMPLVCSVNYGHKYVRTLWSVCMLRCFNKKFDST